MANGTDTEGWVWRIALIVVNAVLLALGKLWKDRVVAVEERCHEITNDVKAQLAKFGSSEKAIEKAIVALQEQQTYQDRRLDQNERNFQTVFEKLDGLMFELRNPNHQYGAPRRGCDE